MSERTTARAHVGSPSTWKATVSDENDSIAVRADDRDGNWIRFELDEASAKALHSELTAALNALWSRKGN